MSTLLERAIALRSPATRDPAYGICTNLNSHSWEREKVRRIITRWPGLGDYCTVFPVEGDPDLYYMARGAGALWDNPRRIDLLEFIIAELEKE